MYNKYIYMYIYNKLTQKDTTISAYNISYIVFLIYRVIITCLHSVALYLGIRRYTATL